jgi:hypothetical protein
MPTRVQAGSGIFGRVEEFRRGPGENGSLNEKPAPKKRGRLFLRFFRRIPIQPGRQFRFGISQEKGLQDTRGWDGIVENPVDGLREGQIDVQLPCKGDDGLDGGCSFGDLPKVFERRIEGESFTQGEPQPEIPGMVGENR